MQTFLPFPDFSDSAATLDTKRLGNQRNECLVIMRALLRCYSDGISVRVVSNPGYAHHAVTRMWNGFEGSLFSYFSAIVHEWRDVRGFKDGTYDRMSAMMDYASSRGRIFHQRDPLWIGDNPFHLAHQSNLIAKKPEHYASLFPGVPDNLPYIYPS